MPLKQVRATNSLTLETTEGKALNEQQLTSVTESYNLLAEELSKLPVGGKLVITKVDEITWRIGDGNASVEQA